MNQSLRKLRSKLLSRHSADELGVEIESETVLASFNENQVGGLRYRVKSGLRANTPIEVELMHDQLDRFHVFIYTAETSALRTRLKTVTKFESVDTDVKRLIQLVREEC